MKYKIFSLICTIFIFIACNLPKDSNSSSTGHSSTSMPLAMGGIQPNCIYDEGDVLPNLASPVWDFGTGLGGGIVSALL